MNNASSRTDIGRTMSMSHIRASWVSTRVGSKERELRLYCAHTTDRASASQADLEKSNYYFYRRPPTDPLRGSPPGCFRPKPQKPLIITGLDSERATNAWRYWCGFFWPAFYIFSFSWEREAGPRPGGERRISRWAPKLAPW